MKQLLISPVIAVGLIMAPVLLTSCGDDTQNAVQGGGVQIDPEVRKAAMTKLQEKGIEFSPVSFAKQLSGNCKAEVLQLFLEAGMSPNGLTGSGMNTLMMLILNGTDKEEVVKCAQLLIKFGVNVNNADRRGQTPLHYAVGRGNPPLVKVLIEAGADVNAVDRSGMSVLDRTFSSEITEMLKAAGAQEKKPANDFNF